MPHIFKNVNLLALILKALVKILTDMSGNTLANAGTREYPVLNPTLRQPWGDW